MIVEELVGRLGFKLQGTQELKKFDRLLVSARQGLANFGREFKRSLGAGVSQLALMGRTMGTVALAGGAVAGGVGLVAMAVLKMGQAFAKARAEAAHLRAEMQKSAKGQRTTAINIDSIGKGFRAIGMEEGAAKEAIKSVYEKVNEAIKDPKSEAAKWFKDHKIATMDKAGNQRDTAAIFDEVVQRYFEQRNQARAARAKAEANPSKRNLDDANKKEWNLRNQWENFPGFDQGLKDHLDAIGGFAEYARRREEFARANPGRTKEEEARDDELDQKWQKFKNAMDGLENSLIRPLENFGKTLSNWVLPALTRFAEGITQFLKNIGLAPKTKGEIEDEKTNNEKRRQEIAEAKTEPDRVKAAQGIAARAPKLGAEAKWRLLFGMGNDAEQAFNDLEEKQNAYDAAKRRHDRSLTHASPEMQAKFSEAMTEAAAAFAEAAEKVRPYLNNDSAKKVSQAAERKVEEHKEYNFSQKNEITLQQTVTGGEAAAKAGPAVVGALKKFGLPSQKDMNAHTGPTSPGP